MKKAYYISVDTATISLVALAETEFVIEASDEEIILLREWFDELVDANAASYVRAHIPAFPYHEDEPNARYDDVLHRIYRFIGERGDERTKAFIATLSNEIGNVKMKQEVEKK